MSLTLIFTAFLQFLIVIFHSIVIDTHFLIKRSIQWAETKAPSQFSVTRYMLLLLKSVATISFWFYIIFIIYNLIPLVLEWPQFHIDTFCVCLLFGPQSTESKNNKIHSAAIAMHNPADLMFFSTLILTTGVRLVVYWV